MDREFEGVCLTLDELMETDSIRLLFGDSWYWLHYRFFNCRDHVLSERSSTIRTHLYNLIAALYQNRRDEPGSIKLDQSDCQAATDELLQIAEYSREFPICLWCHGDTTTKEWFRSEWLDRLPPPEQVSFFQSLPHIERLESERLPYAHNSEKLALKRYRKELASFNKHQKIERKEEQRQNSKAR